MKTYAIGLGTRQSPFNPDSQLPAFVAQDGITLHPDFAIASRSQRVMIDILNQLQDDYPDAQIVELDTDLQLPCLAIMAYETDFQGYLHFVQLTDQSYKKRSYLRFWKDAVTLPIAKNPDLEGMEDDVFLFGQFKHTLDQIEKDRRKQTPRMYDAEHYLT